MMAFRSMITFICEWMLMTYCVDVVVFFNKNRPLLTVSMRVGIIRLYRNENTIPLLYSILSFIGQGRNVNRCHRAYGGTCVLWT